MKMEPQGAADFQKKPLSSDKSTLNIYKSLECLKNSELFFKNQKGKSQEREILKEPETPKGQMPIKEQKRAQMVSSSADKPKRETERTRNLFGASMGSQRNQNYSSMKQLVVSEENLMWASNSKREKKSGKSPEVRQIP